MTRWQVAREAAMKRRREYGEPPDTCEICGRPATDVHHAIIRRRRGWERWLDVPENCALLCHDCHMSGSGDTREFRAVFWRRQLSRGYDMEAWARSLPLRSRSALAEILSLEDD